MLKNCIEEKKSFESSTVKEVNKTLITVNDAVKGDYLVTIKDYLKNNNIRIETKIVKNKSNNSFYLKYIARFDYKQFKNVTLSIVNEYETLIQEIIKITK